MTALPALYDDLEKIPAQLRDYYEWDRGRWQLQVHPVDGVELGAVNAAKADADRCFTKLADRLRDEIINDALRAAGGDRELLQPHLACKIDVDRQTFATRVIGADGKFTTVRALLDELRARPGFAAAFDPVEPPASASSSTAQLNENLTARMRLLKAKRATEVPDLPKGNPWLPSTRNFTHQMVIEKHDPSRAAQLRAAAEGAR